MKILYWRNPIEVMNYTKSSHWAELLSVKNVFWGLLLLAILKYFALHSLCSKRKHSGKFRYSAENISLFLRYCGSSFLLCLLPVKIMAFFLILNELIGRYIHWSSTSRYSIKWLNIREITPAVTLLLAPKYLDFPALIPDEIGWEKIKTPVRITLSSRTVQLMSIT